jgi:methylamine---glutamate N-methyltransferase subunit C
VFLFVNNFTLTLFISSDSIYFCPAGIATQDESLRAKLDKDTAPNGLYNFFTSSVELMKVMPRALGYGSFRELCPENLTSWKAEIADLAGIRFGGVGRR